MARPLPTVDETAPALDAQMAVELQRVAVGAFRGNLLEAVMRLRALGEINAATETLTLLSLAVQVGDKGTRH